MRCYNSPFLLKLFETHETTNSIYFILDVVRGGELFDRIRLKRTFNEFELKEVIRNLLLALEHLHDLNIIHRDLKPENLLLKSEESDTDIILADFGLATKLTDISILFKRCGTPGFVAPEVLKYKEGEEMYTTKCDIFSAGVILYILITGKQPFEGKDFKTIVKNNKEANIDFDC